MSLNVIALGGNAILENDPSDSGQKQVVRRASKCIADFISQQEQVVLCHGNGPQVGNLLLQQNAGKSKKNPVFALDSCVAMTEGSIGYWLQNALYNELRSRKMTGIPLAIVTQVVVDEADPAFGSPSKPIGPFYSEQELILERKESNASFKEDAGRGYRKHVPSPIPEEIVEIDAISSLVSLGIIPICAGGGGVPVVQGGDGELQGIEAVIDKDFSACQVAKKINADNLIILTPIDYVYLHFNQPNQEKLTELFVDEAEAYILERHFPQGSMLPKVQAAIAFTKGKPWRKAIITSLENLANVKSGIGTVIREKRDNYVI